MAAQAGGEQLVQVVALLAAGVVAVPLFKRIGLGSVLGYLAAGLAIGPFGAGLFSDPASILRGGVEPKARKAPGDRKKARSGTSRNAP